MLGFEFDAAQHVALAALAHQRVAHTARHTCAELLTEGSDDNKDLARFVLGHTEPGVTEIYAKTKARWLAPKVLAAWAEILGELYEGAPA